jgi:hypothetical protein
LETYNLDLLVGFQTRVQDVSMSMLVIVLFVCVLGHKR